jgi:hypothetical protein
MTTQIERELARRLIAEEEGDRERLHRELTKVIGEGASNMRDKVKDLERRIECIRNNLRGKNEVLTAETGVSVGDLIAREEQALEALRAQRRQELNRPTPRPDELQRINEQVRNEEEVQDGKRHVRDALLDVSRARPTFEFGFFDARRQKVLTCAITLPSDVVAMNTSGGPSETPARDGTSAALLQSDAGGQGVVSSSRRPVARRRGRKRGA